MQTPDRADLLLQLAELNGRPPNRRAGRFEALAFGVFRYQAVHNPLYARYLSLLNRPGEPFPANLRLTDIPFLPARFFKTHDIKTGDWEPEAVFTSSSTTGQTPSRHLVRDLDGYPYNAHGSGIFTAILVPGVLALLPRIRERGGSSLVLRPTIS